tara:strand:+ start:105 stop:722 length:618 start_codon:yes stop_codon:yes gene_type:complete
MIKERDVAILKFINQFGFCEMPHLDRQFNLHKPYNYELLKKLINKGLIEHEPMFYQRHGIYRLTTEGAKHTNLPRLKKVPLWKYEHEMQLIQVYFELMRRYRQATWISERMLLRDKYCGGVGKTGHVADGLLIFPDDKKIAIEVELSLKGRDRSEKILKQYSTQWGVDEVWYFCSDEVIGVIQELALKRPMIKVHHLKEWLSAKS